MAFVEPIIVVLGPFGGGTSAVAKVLHHLGVFMGSQFDWAYREPHDTWEESRVSLLCRRAFSVPGGQLQMDAGSLKAQLRVWADEHRHAARAAGRQPGVKQPLLCVAVEFMRDAWGPVVPVVVDRPFEKVVASLNRLSWWKDEQERAESTKHLIAARDLALAGTETVRVDFEALRATPAVVIRRLADELHLNVTDTQVEAAVESIVQPADVADADQYGLDSLLAKVERNPEDARSGNILAQIYFDTGDFVNARKWYARQIEMSAFAGEAMFVAMWRIAESMAQLDTPWPDLQDAYLRAWEFRPTRAEPLYALARRYREDGHYRLGYLFAKRAAETPFPEEDMMLVDRAILAWRATDEQAVCASWIGKQDEAFALCRRLLARPDLPDGARERIARNRDFSVPAMIEAASSYPDVGLGSLVAGPRDAEVTVSLVAGPDLTATEQTLNSFLHCCTDLSRVGRFLVLDAGLSARDRAMLHERYGFLEFTDPDTGGGPGAQLAALRAQIGGRFWLHLGHGWRFFAPENFITRLSAVLETETQVFQVGINFADAAKPTGASAAEQAVHRTPDAGRYVLADAIASGPAMFDTARLDRAGGMESTDRDPLAALGRRAAATALHTASLDEVLCIEERLNDKAGVPSLLRLPGAVAYTRSLDKIPGWFYPMDFRLFDFILGSQLSKGAAGDILEIGAYQGKSAILLGYGLRDDDTLVVCDLFGLDPADFESPTEGMGAYTGLTLDGFYNNYDRFHPQRPQVEVCPSSQLEDRIAGRRFRFIHIDGSHAYDCVQSDIGMAIDHTAEDAVIVLDDYRSPHTPGVAAAVWEAALKESIYPFCITNLKLYAAVSRDAQKLWLSALRDFSMADVPWEFEVHQLLGLELLRLWER